MSRKFVITAISAALVLCAIIIIFPDNKNQQDGKYTTTTDASDDFHRTAYFASHGWDVQEISHKSITIPSTFSAAYEEYALIQDKQGMPLREYAGREATIYTYEVTNYRPNNSEMFAELIVCDDKAVSSIIYGNEQILPVS